MGVGKTPPTNQRSMVPPRRKVKRTQNASAPDPQSFRTRPGVWPPNPAVHAPPAAQRTPWAPEGQAVCWCAQGGRQRASTRRNSGYFAFFPVFEIRTFCHTHCQRTSGVPLPLPLLPSAAPPKDAEGRQTQTAEQQPLAGDDATRTDRRRQQQQQRPHNSHSLSSRLRKDAQ